MRYERPQLISETSAYLVTICGGISLVLAIVNAELIRAFFGFLTVCFLAFASLAAIQEDK